MSQEVVLQHLRALVGFDTQNPPRHISVADPLFEYCSQAVGEGFDIRAWDHGDGHVSWFAVKGQPEVLFNVHLDTVPNGEGWTDDPLGLVVREGKAYGRGTCDIKGAAAILLALAPQSTDLALLFTTDEEGAGGCCVKNFCDDGHAQKFSQVVVAEPTGGKAVLGHRGFLSVKTRFEGQPGHSSEARGLTDNANHQMARWAAAALQVAEGMKTSEDDPGSCINIGIVDGGSKSNVIAAAAFVHWSARLRPGSSTSEFLAQIKACADDDAQWEVPFIGQPLPAEGQTDSRSLAFCQQHDLELSAPVDFWTEAALFSAAGIPALVLGPGHIEQAHATDEWVALDQLEKVHAIYNKLVNGDD